jgi:hypothetical protein
MQLWPQKRQKALKAPLCAQPRAAARTSLSDRALCAVTPAALLLRSSVLATRRRAVFAPRR